MVKIQKTLKILVHAIILIVLTSVTLETIVPVKAANPGSRYSAQTVETTVVYTAISAGANHTCALTAAGGVKCWGLNHDGQLGDWTDTDSSVPVDVIGLTSSVTAIASGANHTCALTNTGTVQCWGQNIYGQLGNGTNIGSRVPVAVSGSLSDVKAISAGEGYTCALTNGGAVKCWGRNEDGQLGDGVSTTNHNIPVAVSGLTGNVSAISAGSYHACALTSAGAVKCWGRNTDGQLGDGVSITNHNIPVDVSGLTNGVSALSAGGYHTCAVITGGAVSCWGKNSYGQLGNGDANYTNSNIPVAVSGLTTSSIFSGGFHACAPAGSGVVCWGQNSYGQLGDGNWTDLKSNVPVAVLGLGNDIISISLGYQHSCALLTSGSLKCWGFNLYGQLGDGTSNNSILPVDVLNVDPPGALNKAAPTAGSISSTNSLSLTWGTSSGATSYEYCYDTTNDNACATWFSTGTATSVSISGLPNATYYWQVRAKNAYRTTYANSTPVTYWSFRVLDTTPPRVVSITRPDVNPSTATSLRFTVNFSEVVTGVDGADFNLTAPGITGAAITSVSGSGASRTVTIKTGTGFGTIRLNLIDNDSIKDIAGNPLGGSGAGNGTVTYGPKYTLDRNNTFMSTAAQDGWVLETSENSNLGGSLNTTNNLLLGDDAANKQYRSLLSFYTAGLPDNAIIMKVSLKIRKVSVVGNDPFITYGNLWADMSKGFFSTSVALQAADFQAAATKNSVGFFSAVSGAPGWYQIVLTSANYTYINKVGPTQFRLRFALDDNGDHGADYASFYSGEAALALRPVLVVEYALP